MNDHLRAILDYKRVEVDQRRAALDAASLADAVATADPPRGFERALRETVARGATALIAEIKRASPSKGLIRADFDPPAHARAYAAGGATCLSVLTDGPSFMGSTEALVATRAAVPLPVLRKDFMVDPWQVDEARAMGADAILIIVAALDDAVMRDIEARAFELRMDALIEVHDEGELERALGTLASRMIGVNNRNLRTFTTDLGVTERLAASMPANALVVGESGVSGPADVARLAKADVRALLVGEQLMRADDVEAATRALLEK